MSKIGIIIEREYTTRVKKKSFIIMTLIGPILLAAMFVIPAYLATMEDTEKRVIAVIDETNKVNNEVQGNAETLFYQKLEETPYIHFEYLHNLTLDEIRKSKMDSAWFAVLFIPYNVVASNKIEMFSRSQPNIDLISHIEGSVENVIKQQKLRAENINEEVLKRVETNVSANTIIWGDEGEMKESSTDLAMGIGYICAFLIYIFVFTYGAQVMRGVIEEKTSRVVEVIVSSVKPFQLMMGKIIGVAMVGLTQFALWILLTFVIVQVAQVFMPGTTEKAIEQQMNPAQDIMKAQGANSGLPANTVDAANVQMNPTKLDKILSFYDTAKILTIVLSFLFFFLGGYLLYGSLFAAIGAAVDNETDTQQFMMPITIPLILSIIVMISAIKSPDGPIAFWFSMIPFTSPILMMARIPFGVPWWQLALSASLLVGTFIFTTWIAAKIYRTGILMYGKKVDYKELWKWIRYHN